MNDSADLTLSLVFPRKVLPSVYVFVFVVGLTANVWGLKSLLRNWRKLGDVNVFVLNLGLADLLYLLTLPLLVAYHFGESRWIFGDAFCKVTRFCFNLNLYGSIGFLTCVSAYRYLAIVHPMRVMGRIAVRHSVAVSLLVWLLVSAQSLPDMFFAKTPANGTEKCFETTSDEYVEEYFWYRLVWTLSGFCVPFLVTLGCYGHAIALLCGKNSIDRELRRRSLRLLCVLVLLFSLCYIPFHVFKVLNLRSRVLSLRGLDPGWRDQVYVAHQLSRGLASLNSALNPLVYLHADEDACPRLRKLLRRVLRSVARTNSGGATETEVTNM